MSIMMVRTPMQKYDGLYRSESEHGQSPRNGNRDIDIVESSPDSSPGNAERRGIHSFQRMEWVLAISMALALLLLLIVTVQVGQLSSSLENALGSSSNDGDASCSDTTSHTFDYDSLTPLGSAAASSAYKKGTVDAGRQYPIHVQYKRSKMSSSSGADPPAASISLFTDADRKILYARIPTAIIVDPKNTQPSSEDRDRHRLLLVEQLTSGVGVRELFLDPGTVLAQNLVEFRFLGSNKLSLVAPNLMYRESNGDVFGTTVRKSFAESTLYSFNILYKEESTLTSDNSASSTDEGDSVFIDITEFVLETVSSSATGSDIPSAIQRNLGMDIQYRLDKQRSAVNLHRCASDNFRAHFDANITYSFLSSSTQFRPPARLRDSLPLAAFISVSVRTSLVYLSEFSKKVGAQQAVYSTHSDAIQLTPSTSSREGFNAEFRVSFPQPDSPFPHTHDAKVSASGHRHQQPAPTPHQEQQQEQQDVLHEVSLRGQQMQNIPTATISATATTTTIEEQQLYYRMRPFHPKSGFNAIHFMNERSGLFEAREQSYIARHSLPFVLNIDQPYSEFETSHPIAAVFAAADSDADDVNTRPSTTSPAAAVAPSTNTLTAFTTNTTTNGATVSSVSLPGQTGATAAAGKDINPKNRRSQTLSGAATAAATTTTSTTATIAPLITYYIDAAAPEPIRSALIEGVGWWDQAFQYAGFPPGTFQATAAPPDFDPYDFRYLPQFTISTHTTADATASFPSASSTTFPDTTRRAAADDDFLHDGSRPQRVHFVEWVNRDLRAFSFGARVINPLTGEILKGHARIGSLRMRQDALILEALFLPFSTSFSNATSSSSSSSLSSLSGSATALHKLFSVDSSISDGVTSEQTNTKDKINHTNSSAENSSFTQAKTRTNTEESDDLAQRLAKMQEVVMRRVRQLGAHEVGHTLGLAHNFAGSSFVDPSDGMSKYASVMDYPPPLVTIDEETGDLALNEQAYAGGIGEFDKVVIDYGYRQYPFEAPSPSGASLMSDCDKIRIISNNNRRGNNKASPVSVAKSDEHETPFEFKLEGAAERVDGYQRKTTSTEHTSTSSIRHTDNMVTPEQQEQEDEIDQLNQVIFNAERDIGYVFLTDEDEGSGEGAWQDSQWDSGRSPIEALNTSLRVREIALRKISTYRVLVSNTESNSTMDCTVSQVSSASRSSSYTRSSVNGEGNRQSQRDVVCEERAVGVEGGLADALPGGEQMSKLLELFPLIYLWHRYEVVAAAKMVGGFSFQYSLRGDRSSLLKSPVPAPSQRAALAQVLQALCPSTLRIPSSLLNLLQPNAFGTSPDLGGSFDVMPSRTGNSFDATSSVEIAVELTLQALLHPARVERLAAQSFQRFQEISKYIESDSDAKRRRQQQQEIQYQLQQPRNVMDDSEYDSKYNNKKSIKTGRSSRAESRATEASQPGDSLVTGVLYPGLQEVLNAVTETAFENITLTELEETGFERMVLQSVVVNKYLQLTTGAAEYATSSGSAGVSSHVKAHVKRQLTRRVMPKIEAYLSFYGAILDACMDLLPKSTVGELTTMGEADRSENDDSWDQCEQKLCLSAAMDHASVLAGVQEYVVHLEALQENIARGTPFIAVLPIPLGPPI